MTISRVQAVVTAADGGLLRFESMGGMNPSWVKPAGSDWQSMSRGDHIVLGEESQIALHEQHRDGGNTLLTLAAPLQRPEPQSAPLQRPEPQSAPLQKRLRLADVTDEAYLDKLFATMLTGDPEHNNSMLDAAGVRHYFASDSIRASNAELKTKNQRLCPICCFPCAPNTNRCKNVENCTYQFKKGVLAQSKQQVVVLRNSDSNSNFTELQLTRALERIKASYLKDVNFQAAQTALGLLTLPYYHGQPNSYNFDEHSSADRLHCLTWDAVQLVLNDEGGLSPRFAQMAPGQRVRAIWFREATTIEIKKASLTQSRSTSTRMPNLTVFMASL